MRQAATPGFRPWHRRSQIAEAKVDRVQGASLSEAKRMRTYVASRVPVPATSQPSVKSCLVYGPTKQTPTDLAPKSTSDVGARALASRSLSLQDAKPPLVSVSPIQVPCLPRVLCAEGLLNGDCPSCRGDSYKCHSQAMLLVTGSEGCICRCGPEPLSACQAGLCLVPSASP